MPDNEMCVDSKTNPIPDGKAAVCLKVLIGMVAIAEMALFGVSAYQKTKEKKVGASSGSGGESTDTPSSGTCLKFNQVVADGFSIAFTVIDFSLSIAVGYGVYAPMDASSKRVKDTEYAKLIAETSTACGYYTELWYMKTSFSLFGSIASAVLSSKEFKEAGKVVDITYAFLGSITSLISFGLECYALSVSCEVNSNVLTDSQKKDQMAFQTETCGFFLDDIRAIFDAIVIGGLEIENQFTIIFREVLAAGYMICMFVEAGIVD